MKMKKILCVIMALSLLAAVGCGDTTDTAESEPTTEATTEATIVTTTIATTVFTTKATEKTTTTEATTKASTAPQPNTTEMIDKIANDAKAAAATATPEDLQKALQSLRNYQDFFVNNDTMHYAMYNSQLLYYYYQNTNTPYEQAGFYAFAAIKYVYRGIDTTESADTVDNLSKLETALSQCIDIVPTTPSPTESNNGNYSDENLSVSKKNALSSAKKYIDYMAFSYKELVEQLEYEKYSHEDAVYGADNCGADWNEQAVKKAMSYIDYSSFSYQGLIEQLEFDGFSYVEAIHGADNCGANWNEQAAKKAKSYMDYTYFSRQDLIDQLVFEGFTQEQAEYGVQSVGY